MLRWLMMTVILSGLIGCGGEREVPTSSTDFCAVVTPDLMDQLTVKGSDGRDEAEGKLRLWGRYICLCEGDCPKGV